MSRRRLSGSEIHHFFRALDVYCPAGHYLAMIVLQNGRYMVGSPLERVDGPNGETKIKATCATCAAGGTRTDSQMRWDRLKTMLDKLDERKHRRDIHFP